MQVYTAEEKAALAMFNAEENKRRTLQRSDIASALAKSDMFDFLIDIVPREEAASHTKRTGGSQQTNSNANTASAQTPSEPSSNTSNHVSMQNNVGSSFESRC